MIKIAALGDSLTKGVVLTDKNRYSLLEHSFIDIISNELDLYIENYGKFGSTVDFGNHVIERHSDTISSADYTFLEYGGNDCDFDWAKIADNPASEHHPKTILEAFREKFIYLIQKIRELGSRPVIISLPPIDSDTYFSFFSRFMNEDQKENVMNWLGGNRTLFEIAETSKVQIIDITTPFKNYEGSLKALYCQDGIHPNAEGHRLIAGSISNIYF